MNVDILIGCDYTGWGKRSGRWQSGVTLPGDIQIDVNGFVTIEMESEQPYDHFTEHRRAYPPGKWKKKKRNRCSDQPPTSRN